jgi:hypothetical protein
VDDRARAAKERTVKRSLRLGFSLAVLLVVAALAIREGPRLLETLAGIDGRWAIFGLFLFWAGHLLRSVRLKRLAGDGMRLWPTAASVNALHAVAVYVLPLQAGDLALPGVLGRGGFGVLVCSRLLDVSALGCWIAAAASIWPRGGIPLGLRLSLLGAGLLLALAPWIVRRIGPLARRLPRAILTLDQLALSLALWGLSGGAVWAAARATGIVLDFPGVWLLLAFQLPFQFLPVQGVANAGSHELSWVAGLATLGIPAADSLRFALASHALILGYVLTLAPLAALAWVARTAPGTR